MLWPCEVVNEHVLCLLGNSHHAHSVRLSSAELFTESAESLPELESSPDIGLTALGYTRVLAFIHSMIVKYIHQSLRAPEPLLTTIDSDCA